MSYERHISSNTSAVTGEPSISVNPCLPKNSVSKVSTKSRFSASSRATSSSRSTIAWPMPWPVTAGSTATVRTSPRSDHITCRAPQPTTLPWYSATQNSWTASYSVTRFFSSRIFPAYVSTSRLMSGTSDVRARRTTARKACELSVTGNSIDINHGSAGQPLFCCRVGAAADRSVNGTARPRKYRQPRQYVDPFAAGIGADFPAGPVRREWSRKRLPHRGVRDFRARLHHRPAGRPAGPELRHGNRIRCLGRSYRGQDARRVGADRPLDARRSALVGDGRDPGPRARCDRA